MQDKLVLPCISASVMCIVLSVAIETLLIASGLAVLRDEVLSASIVFFCTTAVLAPAQLLAGGAIARRRVEATPREGCPP
jgi:hypothetical protein